MGLGAGAGAGLGVAPCVSGLAVGAGTRDGGFVGWREVEVVGELNGDYLLEPRPSGLGIHLPLDWDGLLIAVSFR